MPVRSKPRDYFFRDFDAGLLHEIGSKYQMGPPDAVCPILLDGGTGCLLEVRSETSRKVVVEHGEHRYFLKQIPWYCDTDAQIRMSHTIQGRLFDHGVPVPAIVSPLFGDSFVTLSGARFVLFEYVRGRRYTGGSRELENAATVLAAMHAVPLVAIQAPRESLFSLARAHIELLAQVWSESARDALLLDPFLDDTRKAVAEAEASCGAAGFGGLPDVLTHGDFNPWNVIFGQEDEVEAIVDFDNSDIGSRLHDLAEAIVTFCLVRYRDDTTNFADDPVRPPNPDRVRCFMQSYQRQRHLRRDELACLPWALRSVLIELACLGLLRGDFTVGAARRMVCFPIEALPLGEA